MLVSAQELTLVLSLASEPADFMQKYICNEFWSTKFCVGRGFNSRFLIFPTVLCKVWIDKNIRWPSHLTSYQHQQDHNKEDFFPIIPWCLLKQAKLLKKELKLHHKVCEWKEKTKVAVSSPCHDVTLFIFVES